MAHISRSRSAFKRLSCGSPAIAALAAAAALCAAAPAYADTVYQALGGGPGLTCIVDDLFELNLADPRIKDKFGNINIDRLKLRIVDDFCTVTGGPCRFKGISMKGAHGYLQLHQYHFDAMVENLQQAMDGCNVGFRSQNRLLALLGPMERDIVSQ